MSGETFLRVDTVVGVDMTDTDTGGQFPDAISGVGIPKNPSNEEMQAAVRQFKRQGICGRRVVEQHLGPSLLASPDHGPEALELLETVVQDEYANTEFCIRERGSECSWLRGGCKGDR